MDFTNDVIGESITQEDMIDVMAESLDDISVQALYDALPQFMQERLDDLAYDVKTKADYNFHVILCALRQEIFWPTLAELDEKDQAKQCEADEVMIPNQPDEEYVAEKDGKKYILDIYYLAKFERRQKGIVRVDLRLPDDRTIEVQTPDFRLNLGLKELNEWVKENILTDPWDPAPWQYDATADVEKNLEFKKVK